MVTKKRPFAQDFSGESRTDRSFAPGCEVNTIVQHYAQTGVDPFADRLKLQRFGFAATLSYEEACRRTAEIESAFAELSPAERQAHGNNAEAWFEDSARLPPQDDEIVDSGASQEVSDNPAESMPQDPEIEAN